MHDVSRTFWFGFWIVLPRRSGFDVTRRPGERNEQNVLLRKLSETLQRILLRYVAQIRSEKYVVGRFVSLLFITFGLEMNGMLKYVHFDAAYMASLTYLSLSVRVQMD